MNRHIAVCLAVITLLSGLPLKAAGDLRVSWQELRALAEGKEISLVLPDNAHLRGTVLGVEGDKLVLEVHKTSDRVTYPKGRVSIPRGSVRSFGMRKARAMWKVVGTAAGLGAGLAIAAPVNAYTHNEGDGAPLAIAAIIVVPTAVGFLIGWSVDRQPVTVTVVD